MEYDRATFPYCIYAFNICNQFNPLCEKDIQHVYVYFFQGNSNLYFLTVVNV